MAFKDVLSGEEHDHFEVLGVGEHVDADALDGVEGRAARALALGAAEDLGVVRERARRARDVEQVRERAAQAQRAQDAWVQAAARGVDDRKDRARPRRARRAPLRQRAHVLLRLARDVLHRARAPPVPRDRRRVLRKVLLRISYCFLADVDPNDLHLGVLLLLETLFCQNLSDCSCPTTHVK